MRMNVRERILTIRLLDKVNANPALAEAFVESKEASGNNGGKHDAR